MFTGQQLRTTMFLLIGLLMGTFAGKVERPRYHTAYACEGNNLKISCENGQLIQLLRANYGRFSISICNEQGILNWSVKCASEKSYFVIHERCNVVPRCIVNVTSNTFGDPCPGTYKYLEVQYQCMLGLVLHAECCALKKGCTVQASSRTFDDPCPGTTKYLEAHYLCVSEFNPLSSTMLSKTTSTTTTTRPPIIIPITKPRTTTTSTTTPTPSASLGTITTTERPIPTTLLLSPSLSTLHSNSSNSTTVLEYDRKFTRSKTETTTVFYRSSSPPPPVFHNDLYCPPVIARNIIWNWTREGQIAIEKCPAGSTGYARWQCGTKPVVWLPESPDLSECQSMWVDNLHRRIEGDESIIGIATELAVITKTKPLYGGDIRQVSGITQRLVAEMAVSAKDITDSEQRYLGFPNHQQQQIAHELLELMTEISSNLLERYHHDSWRDLSLPEQRTSASALIQVLEESSWHLFESQPPISRFHTFENNLLVSVRRIQTWSTSEVRFPTFKDVEGSDWTRMEDCIVVPTQALLGVAKNGVVDIVFLAYNKLGNFLTAADRGIFRRPLPANKQSNSSHIINSRVLAASVRRHGLVNLHQPAKIVFRHIQEENVTNPRCVYWDFNNRMWSGEGCWTSSTNKTHTECSCNHFTNFALLMEASAIEQYEVFEKASKVAVWNGCTIGMAFILITFLLLIRLRRLKGDMYTIRKNILVCLFLAEIVFLIGIEQTTNRIVCGVVAGFLCYLLLEVFAWALLSVFHLFMVVVDVLDGSTSRSKWYAGFGYSIPAIVVGISAAIDPGSFGNGVNVCWLEYGNFYVMSFVGPVGASIIVSIVLLIFVYHRISQRSDSGMAGKNKEGVKNSIIRAWCTNSMCVLVVLSLTWSSCLWYLYDTSPITIYLFAVSNSLQGALLFILYCVVESQVRIAICDGIRSISWFEACVNSSKPVVSPPSQYIYTNDMMNISVSPISGHESVGNLVLPTPVSSSSADHQYTIKENIPAVDSSVKYSVETNNVRISKSNSVIQSNEKVTYPALLSSTLPALPLPSSGMFSADTEDWMPVSSRYCYDARGSCIKSQLLLFSPDVNRRLENCRLTYTTEHIYETIDRDSVVNQYDSQSCTSEDYNAHSFCPRISTDEGSLRNDNTLTLSSRETRADRYNSSSQRSHHLTLDGFSNVRQCTTVILDSRSVHSPGFHSRCLQKSNNVLSQQVAIEDFESVRKQNFEKEDYINKPSSSENDHSCCLTSVHSVLSVNKEVLENSP